MGIKRTIDCTNFICMYKKEELCSISNIECTGDSCVSFYMQCKSCGDETCTIATACKPLKEIKKDEAIKKTIQPYSYVDGTYKNGVYGYGGFIVDKNGERHILQGHGSDDDYVGMRNVAGEIKGAMAAIKYAIEHNFDSLLIYYDYNGIEYWATGKWQANKKGTMEYKDYVSKCPVKLSFKHVKGHSGIAGNELADRLAKEAIGLVSA